MRNRLSYGLFILLLLVGSFLAGSWFSKRETKTELSNVKSPAINAAVKADTHDDGDNSSLPPGTVNVSSDKQQLIGVKVAKVEKASWNFALRVLGRVVPDENRIYRVNSATDGWVRKILPLTTGSLVKKDELLATFFSPEFFSGIKAYLYGLRSLDRFEKSGKETKEQLELTGANIENYRNTLRNLGMTEYQLDEIMRTRQGPDSIDIRAPAAGFILVRNLFPGQRFEKGTELYRIADLSQVWILADIFENESQYLRPGTAAKVKYPAQNKTFHARISDILPQFDPTTRTLKIRIEADNPSYALRPDMFVDVEIPVQLPPAITVPADAVLDSGLRKTVFVDQGNGGFEPREVETGRRLGNRVEIVQGLKPGEQIVISGNFLIDSESKLEMAASGMQRTLSKDPVCGMEIAPKKAEKEGRKTSYRGKTYYFDSDECKQQFEKNPTRFIQKTSEETSVEKAPASKALKKSQGHDHS